MRIYAEGDLSATIERHRVAMQQEIDIVRDVQQDGQDRRPDPTRGLDCLCR